MFQVKNIDDLTSAWQQYQVNKNIEAGILLDLGKSALEFGHPSLAYDVLKNGITQFPDNTEITYLAALSLARNNSFSTASTLLKKLLDNTDKKNKHFPNILSLAGRLAKDSWSRVNDPDQKVFFSNESKNLYKQAFELSNDYYPGINAATMSLVSGDEDNARRLAQEVYKICQKLINMGGNEDLWLYATLGEASLLLDNYDEAESNYKYAAQLARENYGDIASIRKQLRYLSPYKSNTQALQDLLSVPVIIAFTGHMLDQPIRNTPRFPAEIESEVRQAIEKSLSGFKAILGYSSAACGSDILFLEALQKEKNETHIILPFKKSDFIISSVGFAGDQWVKRLEKVLAEATTINYATNEGYLNDDILFKYANNLIHGKTILKARELESNSLLLTVADESQSSDSGGTLDSINHWNAIGKSVIKIDLAAIRNKYQGNILIDKHKNSNEINSNNHSKTIAREIKTMLFADCVGFSRLGEESAPSFFVNFLGGIGKIISNINHPPVFSNTWGDGLFLVFDDIFHAADLALQLKEMVLETDWVSRGLPADTNIRIALHTGPVYSADDPIIHKKNFYGTHVNTTARIEPITAPGAVFVTEQFACMLAARKHHGYDCDYLGLVELAKKFGSGSLYRLRRTNMPE